MRKDGRAHFPFFLKNGVRRDKNLEGRSPVVRALPIRRNGSPAFSRKPYARLSGDITRHPQELSNPTPLERVLAPH